MPAKPDLSQNDCVRFGLCSFIQCDRGFLSRNFVNLPKHHCRTRIHTASVESVMCLRVWYEFCFDNVLVAHSLGYYKSNPEQTGPAVILYTLSLVKYRPNHVHTSWSKYTDEMRLNFLSPCGDRRECSNIDIEIIGIPYVCVKTRCSAGSDENFPLNEELIDFRGVRQWWQREAVAMVVRLRMNDDHQGKLLLGNAINNRWNSTRTDRRICVCDGVLGVSLRKCFASSKIPKTR